jgi:hypothetical protein
MMLQDVAAHLESVSHGLGVKSLALTMSCNFLQHR